MQQLFILKRNKTDLISNTQARSLLHLCLWCCNSATSLLLARLHSSHKSPWGTPGAVQLIHSPSQLSGSHSIFRTCVDPSEGAPPSSPPTTHPPSSITSSDQTRCLHKPWCRQAMFVRLHVVVHTLGGEEEEGAQRGQGPFFKHGASGHPGALVAAGEVAEESRAANEDKSCTSTAAVRELSPLQTQTPPPSPSPSFSFFSSSSQSLTLLCSSFCLFFGLI